jgi:filamentous hemagglutinin
LGMTLPVAGPVGGVVEGTASVWESVVATQEVYEGTLIPRSFELTTEGAGRVWVHGNATEHIAEFVISSSASVTPEGVVHP